MNAVIELEEAYNHFKNDPDFLAELDDLLKIMQDVRLCFIMRKR